MVWRLDYLPIVRHKRINCVWHCRICQNLMKYIRQTHIGVRYKSMEVQIPDSVVLSGLDYVFNHVKFEPYGASRRIRFIIMQSSIICGETNKVGELSLNRSNFYIQTKLEISGLHTNFVFQPDMKVGL